MAEALKAWADPPAPMQLPLLAPPEPEADAAEPVEAGKPGRPKGALNKRTQAFADHLLRQYRSPLEVMAAIYSRPVERLAGELGCSLLEAARLQFDCSKELAPYIHSKMPVAIDMQGKPGFELVLNLLGGAV
ncbi:MAG: hypothetical protein ACRER4_07580, partial [Steroidobacteraceae bacterium]